ncbi:hypothetical protein [Halorientalis regularis]|uniref:hypothetical protein n=1 Tax=Halorientalis regularis TaxID=660518 RepID=UPI001113872E|nr:hypothetical protein [Halorientalis regularis]
MGNSSSRKAGGLVAGLLLLLMLSLIGRQYQLWTLTQDKYYVFSLGLYLVVAIVFFAGVVWGFYSGEQAKDIYQKGAGAIIALSFFISAYYWIVGRVIGSDPLEIYSGIVWFFTGLTLAAVTAGINKVAERRGTAT